MNKTPTTLIIMDGFGLSNDTVGNAVRAANTPVLDGLFADGQYAIVRVLGVRLSGQPPPRQRQHTPAAGAVYVLKEPPLLRALQRRHAHRQTPTSPQLVAFIITQAAALCHHYINAAAPPKRTGGRKNFGILPSSPPRVYS